MKPALIITAAIAVGYIAAAIYGNWLLNQAYLDIQRRAHEFPPAL